VNISDEAIEAAARVSYKHRTGRSWDDASRHAQLIERSWTRGTLEAAAPHLMAAAFVRGYQSALVDRDPINQASNRRAPKWSRKMRSAGAGE
jgi:hypothetical protein